jgi:hypothetical protein
MSRTTAGLAAAIFALVAFPIVVAQDLPPADEGPELVLITGEVVEVDVETGVIVIHVEAVEDQEVEHFDLEVWFDEETLFENESGWKIESVRDLEGTLVDVEGFMDVDDVFIADVIWVIEGPVDDEELPTTSVTA